jgi:hypothetical protein
MRLAHLLALATTVALGMACTAATAPSVAVKAAVQVVASDAGAGPARKPVLTEEDALATGRTLAAAWGQGAKYDREEVAELIARHHLDEARLLELLHGIVDACLAEPDAKSVACRTLNDDASDGGKASEALTELLGIVADPRATNERVIRLLVALEARDVRGSGGGLDSLLDRRWAAALAAREAQCKPPTPNEIAGARVALGDLAIVTPAPTGPARARGTTEARWPTSAELETIAYFYASIANAGPEVGSAKEDATAQPLPDGHPALAERARLRGELQAARLDGDVDAQLRAAEAYLGTLGYPGPLRLAEDSDICAGAARARPT